MLSALFTRVRNRLGIIDEVVNTITDVVGRTPEWALRERADLRRMAGGELWTLQAW